MNLTAKLQPVIIIASALLGLALGYTTGFGAFSARLIEPFLMILLFFVFLSVDLRGLGKSFGNFRFTMAAVLINFVWTPVFAFLLGRLFLGGSVDLRTGFLMLMVTPCTDWYIVFTGLAKGNVPLSTAILPLNLVLQVALLPVYLFVFMGGELQFHAPTILMSIVIVLVVPFLLAQAVKLAAARANGQGLLDKVQARGDDLQLFFLCLAVVSMFASESRAIADNPVILLRMLLPVVVFFAVNFLLAGIVGRRMGFPFPDTVSLTMTTLARNSPLSLAIAVAAFPDRPLISLALVIGPLIELPALGIVSGALLRMGSRKTSG